MASKPPAVSARSWVFRVRRVTTPKGPAAAALEGPEQFGILAGVDHPGHAVCGDHLGLDQGRGGKAVALGKGSEPAALDQARHADIGAAAALDVAAGLGGYGAVGIRPHGAGADGDGRNRRDLALAALRNEGVMHGDVVHRPRPDEEGIGGVGGALVAVPAALHHQPQIVLAREIHGRDHVGGVGGLDRPDAEARLPGVEPARDLGAAGLIANIVGVGERLEEISAGRRLGIGLARLGQGDGFDQASAHRLLQPLPGGVAGPPGVTRSDAGYARGGGRERGEGAGQEGGGGGGFQQRAAMHGVGSPT